MYGSTLQEARSNVVETYDNVTFRSTVASDPLPANYVRTLVNSRSEYIAFIGGNITARPVNSVPTQLTGGGDGDTSTVDFIGAAAANSTVTGTGLRALDKLTDVNLIAIPGRGDVRTVNAGMALLQERTQVAGLFFHRRCGPGRRCELSAARRLAA